MSKIFDIQDSRTKRIHRGPFSKESGKLNVDKWNEFVWRNSIRGIVQGPFHPQIQNQPFVLIPSTLKIGYGR